MTPNVGAKGQRKAARAMRKHAPTEAVQ